MSNIGRQVMWLWTQLHGWLGFISIGIIAGYLIGFLDGKYFERTNSSGVSPELPRDE